ncbi:unnamed protein product [Caretta caretta]
MGGLRVSWVLLCCAPRIVSPVLPAYRQTSWSKKEAVTVVSEQLAGEEEEEKRLRERIGEMCYIQRMDTGHR